jgi:transcriptional regulator with XRE-family HTH domain
VVEAELSFAGLLRQLRAEAKLTQEELADAAGLSPRSVSDLERGIAHTAHKDTAMLLADALGPTEPARTSFVTAARGRGPAEAVLGARGPLIPRPSNLPAQVGTFIGVPRSWQRSEPWWSHLAWSLDRGRGAARAGWACRWRPGCLMAGVMECGWLDWPPCWTAPSDERETRRGLAQRERALGHRCRRQGCCAGRLAFLEMPDGSAERDRSDVVRQRW